MTIKFLGQVANFPFWVGDRIAYHLIEKHFGEYSNFDSSKQQKLSDNSSTTFSDDEVEHSASTDHIVSQLKPEPSAPELPKVMALNSSEGPAYPKLTESNLFKEEPELSFDTKFLNQVANFSGKVDNLISSVSDKAANFSNKADNFIFNGLNAGLSKAETFSNKIVGLAFSKMVEEDSEEYINSVDKISKFPIEKASAIVEPSAPEMDEATAARLEDFSNELLSPEFSFRKDSSVKFLLSDDTIRSFNAGVVYTPNNENNEGGMLNFYPLLTRMIMGMCELEDIFSSNPDYKYIEKLSINGNDINLSEYPSIESAVISNIADEDMAALAGVNPTVSIY